MTGSDRRLYHTSQASVVLTESLADGYHGSFVRSVAETGP
jgi:hypothetical protein